MQQGLIAACGRYNLPATVNEHTGVWVNDSKIAALGLSPRYSPGHSSPSLSPTGLEVKRGITMHGFALNVNPDLSFYDHIVPCGIVGKGVTSLQAELKRPGKWMLTVGPPLYNPPPPSQVPMNDAIVAALCGLRQEMGLELTAQASTELLDRIWQASPFTQPIAEASIGELQKLVDQAQSQVTKKIFPATPACSVEDKLDD